MNALLEQFISETREALQGIGEKLMHLEREPDSSDVMTELFRLVHTLKGNSGLFDLPELTRVLHAGEDLMDAVRHGKIAYSQALADTLLDAMDFIGVLCDEVESQGSIDSKHINDSVRLADTLRLPIVTAINRADTDSTQVPQVSTASKAYGEPETQVPLADVPEKLRMEGYRAAVAGDSLYWITYKPVEECFFQGDDPFHQARQTPGVVWGSIAARNPWPKLIELDPYCCSLDFSMLCAAPQEDLEEYYRYVPDQVNITPVSRQFLVLPQGDPNGGPVYEDFVADALRLLQSGNTDGLIRTVNSMLEFSNPELWISSALRWLSLVIELEPKQTDIPEIILNSLRTLTPPDWNALEMEGDITEPSASPTLEDEVIPLSAASVVIPPEAVELLSAQREILSLPDDVEWLTGRISAVAISLAGCLNSLGMSTCISEMETALGDAHGQSSSLPLLSWLEGHFKQLFSTPLPGGKADHAHDPAPTGRTEQSARPVTTAEHQPETEVKFGRRAEDNFNGPKSIKVDQAKIDRLMNLIGEMVVAKNSLPYLAGRAESIFGVRELSREIKAQYAVINRIAEEMQDSIMQVRMMPVSFVFQRFSRLVRDTSHKLGKEVNLILEGEETEADKNVIESLGDPLIHIIRNSLDHGIEKPDVRRALGKPSAGTLLVRASQESDRVLIEIRDDGKGMDPEVIKRKALEKGIIDNDRMERMTDQEAINLVFAPGFSTAEVVSDLSGRGVGMDVVRTAIEKVNGTITLESEKGKGTRICLSLPLSMAVTNVMIVESNNQIFGVPMESVVETVRIAQSDIRAIKKSQTTVLRGRIVPLKTLNSLLGLDVPQKKNDEGEIAVLIVSLGGDSVGIMVDDFHETVDIILKPMNGVLANLSAYSGSALLGDGSVLMVLNLKEVV